MPYRILVVDDEPDIREIVSILLQKKRVRNPVGTKRRRGRPAS